MEHESLFEQAPLPDEILSDIESVQGPIIRKLNQWLSTLEGQTFEPEQARRVVDKVRYVVARAGCELLLDGQPVGLSSSKTNRAKSASIIASTLREKPQRSVYGRVAFPRVLAAPLVE